MDEIAELRDGLDRLRSTTNNRIVRGIRAVSPHEIARFASLRDELWAADAEHLTGRLGVDVDSEALRVDDRAAPPALLRALTVLRLLDRKLTQEVAARMLAQAIDPEDE